MKPSQPGLAGMWDVPTTVTLRKHVRPTSIAQYQDGRARFEGRKAEVLRWLSHYFNRYQVWPTSAELMRFAIAVLDETFDHDALALLYVRRGLSDLQTAGVVEAVPDGKRRCQVSGRVCETWRVIPVGR